MFNIHSTEVILILIVALIVIGPEKLPSAVRTASLWIGRFRRSFYKVKSEIERELNADEIRRQLHNESIMAEIEEAKSEVQGVAKSTEDSVKKIVNSGDFDPGASSATDTQQSEEKSIKEEIQEAGEQVEEVAKQLYDTSKNPKLQAEIATPEKPKEEKPNNDIS